MKTLALWCATFIPVLATGCIYALTCKPLPEIKGEIAVAGLHDEVRIIRDAHGIPHIFARNEDDSYLALGYVHAQDRLWQLDVMRHLAEGRLSEIVGNREVDNALFSAKTTVDLDLYNRILGFKHLSERSMERMDDEAKKAFELYSSGINSFVAQHARRLPAEFVLLDHQFEPWRPQDTVAIYSYLAWSLNNDWYAEFLRYALAEERGIDKAWELLPPHADPGPFILEEAGRAGSPCLSGTVSVLPSGTSSSGIAELLQTARLMDRLNYSLGFQAASNNWVVGGTRTDTGRPILCNDPHLPLTVPSIWYQIHINRPGMDVMGVMFPGTPGIAIGRNRRIAWGNTTPFEDSMDLYIEKMNPADPGEYLYKGSYRPCDTRIEEICYKDGKEMKCLRTPVRMTVHGTVINDIVPSLKNARELFALKWSAFDIDYREKKMRMLKLGEATHWDEFIHSIDIGIPLFNWIYADVDGNIGYATPGLIPYRSNSDGTYPQPGWTGAHEWQGYVPLEKLPQTFNPPKGFIVTANNHIAPEGVFPYTFSKRFMPSYRAARIRELILQKPRLGVEDMKTIQRDVYTKQGERLAKYFVEAYERAGDKSDALMEKAVDSLRQWDFQCNAASIGATVFHVAYNRAFERILKDEMSEPLFKAYSGDVAIESSFDNLLEKEESELFDDRHSRPRESKHEILVRSLEDAVQLLREKYGSRVTTWTWGKIHPIEMEHLTFGRVKFLKSIFNIGSWPMPGSRHTINNAYYDLLDRYTLVPFVGSSFREINDMSSNDTMLAIISTGQSGQRFSTHYDDQTARWLEGEYNEVHMDLENILKDSEGQLVLVPPK